MLADRAMVKSLGWVQRRWLATEFTSGSSGSSDLGMHLVAPTMILHWGREEKGKQLFVSTRNNTEKKPDATRKKQGYILCHILFT